MTTVLGDKFVEAINAKNNDIKTFVWKGAKELINGEKVQNEIRLVDATPEQLNKFYAHCKSMLYSNDKVNPGRYVLLDIIKEQRAKCNAELYLRYLEDGNPENGRDRYSRFQYLQDLKAFLNNNKELFPREVLSETLITETTTGIPAEFSDLSIDLVLDACLDTLGRFEKKHITLNFITKMGLWFEPQEMKDLTEKDETTGKVRDRLEVIKERLNLKSSTKLRLDPKGLNYCEFRAMILLKSKKYSALNTDQLLALRNKVLFRLEEEVAFHASQWETRMDQIRKVAESRGIVLND